MLDDVLEKLSRSDFRRRFALSAADKDYARRKGRQVIEQHARDFISRRIAPAGMPNDGKQTPMRGHPVFVAQHATACCCRGCIAKWHGFSREGTLSAAQQDYLVKVIMYWLDRQMR